MSRPTTVGDKKIIRKHKGKKQQAKRFFHSMIESVDSRGALRLPLAVVVVSVVRTQRIAFLFPSLLRLACENRPPLGLAFPSRRKWWPGGGFLMPAITTFIASHGKIVV